ncbi:MAG: cytochrome c oxidase assembly protein [Opitutaceae bacterium]|nr:cytochrome c oxidase assembly protein [Opitutaceae bacterium]
MIDWRHWHNEPYLIGGLILLGWIYALATGPFRTRIASTSTPFPRARAWAFYSALLIFYLAVGSPLDQAGERFLLSAHMIQHLLLIYPAAVLFLVGLPAWLVAPVTDQPSLRRILRILTHPLCCGTVYTLVLSLWHVPAIYDWALQDKVIHVIEHIMFFVAALFYWWPILSPSPRFPRLVPGVQILYLIGVTIGMTPLFSFIAFSDTVLYPTYEFAPRLFATFGPQEDQLLGAAIMKLGGMAVTFCAIAVGFYRWYAESELRRSSPEVPSRLSTAKGP